MSRPNVRDQRSEQIIDAFEVCVARYGVEGATLERIAKQAGLARALIRHNIGNREALIVALVQRFRERSRVGMQTMVAALPRRRRLETMIDWLFDPAYSDAHLVQVSSALIAAAPREDHLAQQMGDWLNEFTTSLQAIISEEHPNADPTKVAAITAGITGIYFNVETLYPLIGVDTLSKSSKMAALLLIGTL